MKSELLLALAGVLVHSSMGAFMTSKKEMVVEVFFVVDYKAFQIYTREESTLAAATASMEADIEYFLTEVNKRFASMSQFIKISIRKRKLEIHQTSSIGPKLRVQAPNLVNAVDALGSFTAWLNGRGARAALNYDLALLWTGYNLYNTSEATAGYAYVGTVCDAKGNSVVEFDGTYSTVITTAHEIAHNLGASHDSGSTGYVMAAETPPNSKNRWDFSLCSASDVMGVLNQLTENCLLYTSPMSTIPQGAITYKLGEPSTLCKRKRGPGSFLCTDLYTSAPKGDAICKSLFCSDPNGGNMCSAVISSDGLLCGRQKTCQEGTCQNDSTSVAAYAVTDGNCLFGDSPSVTFTMNNVPYTGDCAGFLDTYGYSLCEETLVFSKCCKICVDRKDTSKPTCPYGDSPKISFTTGALHYSTCVGLLSEPSRHHRCENNYVFKECCRTCELIKDTSNPTCPYGDRNPECSNHQPYQICDRYEAVCCGTCRGYTGRRRREVTYDLIRLTAPEQVEVATPPEVRVIVTHVAQNDQTEAETAQSHEPLPEA